MEIVTHQQAHRMAQQIAVQRVFEGGRPMIAEQGHHLGEEGGRAVMADERLPQVGERRHLHDRPGRELESSVAARFGRAIPANHRKGRKCFAEPLVRVLVQDVRHNQMGKWIELNILRPKTGKQRPHDVSPERLWPKGVAPLGQSAGIMRKSLR